jgi:hypothetical protein
MYMNGPTVMCLYHFIPSWIEDLELLLVNVLLTIMKRSERNYISAYLLLATMLVFCKGGTKL